MSDRLVLLGTWAVQGILRVHGWVRSAVSFLPDFTTTGFAVSYSVAMLTFPFFLAVGLYAVWSIASVGPVRKSFSTALIVAFAVPLYPVLMAIALGIIWIVICAAMLAIAVVAPIALAMLGCQASLDWLTAFVAEQRRGAAVVEDMSCAQVLSGVAAGLFCLCTFGVCSATLTLVKSPVLFLACVWHGTRLTLPSLLWEAGPYWCLPAFFCWCLAFLGAVCGLLLAIVASALVKLLLSAVWPAYVATGWLRYVGGGGRRRDASCGLGLYQGLKAGYQVLWAGDLLTNALVVGDADLAMQAADEYGEIVLGRREELSPECRVLSCLPPVAVGLYLGSWDMVQRAAARQLGVSVSTVQEAWASLREQMIQVGREAINEGLLTRDYVLEVPPGLVIGLPARVLLGTVERSRGDSGIVLATGLRIGELDMRRGGALGYKVWEYVQSAKATLANSELTEAHMECLRGALLAGGSDPCTLPPRLAEVLADFERLPADVRGSCSGVRADMVAAATECSREQAFRSELGEVIQALGAEDASSSPLVAEVTDRLL